MSIHYTDIGGLSGFQQFLPALICGQYFTCVKAWTNKPYKVTDTTRIVKITAAHCL